MNKPPDVILITGARRAGKDSFFKILNNLYPKTFQNYSFADALKMQLNQFSEEMFHKNVFDLEGDEKEIFRPLMIALGCSWRNIDPLHWVKVVDEKMEWNCGMTKKIPCILDARFPNEITYFKDKYENSVVVEIIRENGVEPTDEEKKNIPLLKPLIDYTLIWPTAEPDQKIEILTPYVQNFYNKYF